MSFRLSVSTVQSCAEQYEKVLSAFGTTLDTCYNAVRSLAGIVWEGKTEFYEKLLVWVQEAKDFYQRLSYLEKVTMRLNHQAKVMQARYAAVPESIGAGSELSDVIYFDDKSFSLLADTIINSWQGIRKSLNDIKDIGTTMRYWSLDMTEAGEYADNAISAVKLLDNFNRVFSEYADAVRAFEEETANNLAYAMSEDFDGQRG